MKVLPVFKFLMVVLVVFFYKVQGNNSFASGKIMSPADTIIGSKVITNEIPGGAYRKRAKSYFLIINNDTSRFDCICTEAKEGQQVDMIISHGEGTMTYRQRMAELKKIIPAAAKDFNLDSLNSVEIGRLAGNGDLAIDITNEYRQKMPTGDRITNNKLSQFLKGSKLGADFNEIFKPYSLKVDYISLEEWGFIPKRVLYLESKIETSPAKVPEKILDCSTWVTLKKIKTSNPQLSK